MTQDRSPFDIRPGERLPDDDYTTVYDVVPRLVTREEFNKHMTEFGQPVACREGARVQVIAGFGGASPTIVGEYTEHAGERGGWRLVREPYTGPQLTMRDGVIRMEPAT